MAYSTISKPSLHFNTKLYTGTGSSNSITGVGFQPDWTWLKERGDSGYHWLTDAVRGVTKTVYTNSTEAQQTKAQGLTAFGTDGFTLGTNADINGSGDSLVSWNWKAGGGQGSSNTAGSINTTYTSVNTTAGISISQFTGTGSNATVGHGLGVVPKMYIVKGLVGTRQWAVYHESIGNTQGLTLNSNASKSTETSWWNSTSPTSSVITVGTSANANDSGNAMLVYAFAEIKGFSKFGKYQGNANGKGPFVYTGFKPAWLMVKNASVNSTEWYIYDSKRGGPAASVFGNPNKYFLKANSTAAEGNETMDFYSNGFRPRITNNFLNGSGNELVFMAFADEPLVANVGQSVPATAR